MSSSETEQTTFAFPVYVDRIFKKKLDHHDITKILLKVALNNMTP
jgi:hypothetical protein